MKNTIITLVLLLAVAGCTTTQKGTGIGAVAGTAIGGIVGYQSGHAVEGAAIGAAAGGLGGYAVGKTVSKNKFCPVCGKQFDGETTTYCPFDGTELKPVQ